MSVALAYHRATVYDPASIGGMPALDWSAQPAACKDYHEDGAIDLARFLPFDPNPFTGSDAGPEAYADAAGTTLATLARLVYATYGVTGLIRGERTTLLRSAPSAGGLTPAELYVVIRDWEGIPPGLYGYQPRRHALVPLWEGDEVAGHLATACYGSAEITAAPACLVVTGIFERSRWRYRERAYRRILLDSGHLLGNALLAAPALGLRTHLTTAFHDTAVDTLLRLDDEAEGTLAVVAVAEPGPARHPSWTSLPGPTGPAEAAPFLEVLHAACRLPPERPTPVMTRAPIPATGAITTLLGSDAPWSDAPLDSIASRRSTRSFAPEPLEADILGRILDLARRAPSLGHGTLRTLVVVHAVTGLDPGVYRQDVGTLTLRRIRPALLREATGQLCLGQDLGRDAAALVIHTADLPAAVRLAGDRVYRDLHLEAGLIGQHLNLAALAEDAGASGIAGFFDQAFADDLGLERDEAILYITVLGPPNQR
jgi:SagB-type dehydrogenase family enzyme